MTVRDEQTYTLEYREIEDPRERIIDYDGGGP